MALLDRNNDKTISNISFGRDAIATKKLRSYDPMLEYLELEPKQTQ